MDDAFIDRAEAFYRAHGHPAMFRITDMAAGIDALLAERGYVVDAPTLTFFRDLPDGQVRDEVRIDRWPGAAWLDARNRLSGATADNAAAYRSVIEAILLPCGFASLAENGVIRSLAYGAVQDDLLILESVMTDPAAQGRGLARRCLSGLLGWASGQGVRAAALQVMADNEPALRLYRALGFTRFLYGYHYRVKG